MEVRPVKNIEENNQSNEKINIKLERHLWPDEIKARRNKNIKKGLIVLGLVASFIIGIIFNSTFLANQTNNLNGNPNLSQEYSKLQSILNILSDKWYFIQDFEDPNNQLIDNAIKGMLDLNGDIHTEYLSVDELQDFQSGLNANFVGIGVQYYNIDGYNIVRRVLSNSPAQKAGVMPGDIFYAVNGESVIGMDLDKLSDMVRGEEESVVSIDFKRGEAIVNLKITRGPVLSSAFGEMIDESIGYLEIQSFSLQTGDEVGFYLDEMSKQGLKKLIIDVRDDGGGYINTLVQIASYFLDEDQVVIQEEFNNQQQSTTYSRGNVYENIEEIVMLVNQNSASASEVLTAALQENLGIEVVGVNTYGKGTVQLTYEFNDGSALKYTTAQWLTPNGNKIHGVGIKPTQEVKLHEVFYQDYPNFEEEIVQSFLPDSVGYPIQYTQYVLDFLGYDIDRFDGYYSEATQIALEAYQTSLQMRPDAEINKALISQLSSSIIREWNINQDIHDVQLQKAIELLK